MNARYVECPEDMGVIQPYQKSLFMAGGITNCPNWQQEFKELLMGQSKLVLINPRRPFFDVRDPDFSVFQIKWEYDHLEMADMVSFWFPKETLCPITLFELGKISMTKKPIFVGTHPEYQRKIDVIQQLRHLRPEVLVAESLERLSTQVIDFIKG